MNINASDPDHSPCASDDLISSSLTAAGEVYHVAEDTLNSAFNRGRKVLKSVHRHIERDSTAACKILHKHPYLSVLVGIGGGLAIGYLVAGKHSEPN